MGLDMFLEAKRSYSGYAYEDSARKKELKSLLTNVRVLDQADPNSPYATVSFTIGYWRKMNGVHGWFHRNCGTPDNDISFEVSRDHLEKLRRDCAEALIIKPEMVSVGRSHIDLKNIAKADLAQAIKDSIVIESHRKEFNDLNDKDPLRPTSGFFFGNTEKDDRYYDGLNRTIAICDKALALNESWRFTYEASY